MRVYAQTYASSPELPQDDLGSASPTPAELYENARDAEAEVDEDWEPTTFDLLCYLEAAEAYQEYIRYGMPLSGTIRDQPHRWRLAIDAVTGAVEHARADAASVASRARTNRDVH